MGMCGSVPWPAVTHPRSDCAHTRFSGGAFGGLLSPAVGSKSLALWLLGRFPGDQQQVWTTQLEDVHDVQTSKSDQPKRLRVTSSSNPNRRKSAS
ncbi:hypothetical protein PR048_025640 [Dryococelus australis]|uniref:Uncharacterized protein n=1 Tax=Dryococelus australis TaxID=614101 RepID=A0ABQ9GRW4_9NEOP|nr:hypothetical protein PR048_025640 [Dryococelus australis]